MSIRCRMKPGHPERARHMKFKCRWCKRWVCGVCEGTHDANDPVGNRLCDPCWSRRFKQPCACGGFWQGGGFVHAERCTPKQRRRLQEARGFARGWEPRR